MRCGRLDRTTKRSRRCDLVRCLLPIEFSAVPIRFVLCTQGWRPRPGVSTFSVLCPTARRGAAGTAESWQDRTHSRSVRCAFLSCPRAATAIRGKQSLGLRPGEAPSFSAHVSGFPARGTIDARVCGFHQGKPHEVRQRRQGLHEIRGTPWARGARPMSSDDFLGPIYFVRLDS
jgi:hypothetical protein